MTNKYFAVIILISTLISLQAKELNRSGRPSKTAGSPNGALLNINKISAWYEADGESERNPATGNSGLSYPAGTSYAIYASGLMMGALCTDGVQNTPRVTGFSYNKGFTPGAILGIRTGATENPAEANVRIWRIRKDYAIADLAKDAAETNSKNIGDATPAEIAVVRAQYRKDWTEWPAAKGAPFYDANNDGIYTPQFETVDGKEIPKVFPNADEPGIAQADQVIWYVCNDIRNGESPWKTKSMGIEQQVTIWGYKTPGAMEHMLFKKFKLIYKGTALTPDTAKLTQMYLSYWSDPDLGDAGDDFVGCDTVIGIGFIYNSKSLDAEYQKFNLVPPAVGYDLLQGPIIPSSSDTAVFNLKRRPGFKNLPMTSFTYFAAGGTYSDPPFNLNGSIQWYQMMRGLPQNPQGPPDPAPLNDAITGLPTKFLLTGDPVTRTGWIDGIVDNPGDRRMIQSSGPFTMALGDTQEIVLGVIGGLGKDNLHSYTVLKENDRIAQSMFNSLFQSIPPSVRTTVTYPNSSEASVRITAAVQPGSIKNINAKIGGITVQLFDDGGHEDGTSGDGIFSNSVTLPCSITPVNCSILFTDKNNALSEIPNAIERITIAGPLRIQTAPIFFENVNADGFINNGEYIRFGIGLKNETSFPINKINIVSGSKQEAGKTLTCAVIQPNAGRQTLYNYLDQTSYFTLRLPYEYSAGVHTEHFRITDSSGNSWEDSIQFPVVQQKNAPDSLSSPSVNLVGRNDGQVGFVLYNPATAGRKFEIWYGGNYANFPAQFWTLLDATNEKEYSPLTAFLPSNNLGIMKATAIFTLSKKKEYLKYAIQYSGMNDSNAVGTFTAGDSTKTITFKNFTAEGIWSSSDSVKPFLPYHASMLISGRFSLNVKSLVTPSNTISGSITHGVIPRRSIPTVTVPSTPVFEQPENIIPGFSLFVGPAPLGYRSVQQTQPTAGSIIGRVNPEKSYSLVPSDMNYGSEFRRSEENIEIRFNNGINWAICAAESILYPTPTQAYFMKVPFAVYKDTVRVWPVVKEKLVDSVWNTNGNGSVNGKPVFDIISGINNSTDGSFNDIRYFSSLNTVFPPTSAAMKGRLISQGNIVATSIRVVNESNDGIPPVSGTTIKMIPYFEIKPGDIKQITLRTSDIHSVIGGILPTEYSLSQNYPNPFNPSTRIEFALPRQSNVSLKIYDVVGREVAVLFNEKKDAGKFSIEWNGRDHFNTPVASGVYFYRMNAGNFIQTKKMILIK